MKTSVGFENDIISRARASKRRICLPEAQFDARVLSAACKVYRSHRVQPVLIGEGDKIRHLAAQEKLDIDCMELLEPATSPHLEHFSRQYVELRHGKEELSFEDAKGYMIQSSYFSAMLVRKGLVDGICSGAYFTTADVLRPSFRVIGLKPGIQTVSALCPMMIDKCALGENLLLFAADCAVVPQPSCDQLVEITFEAADIVTALTGESPKVALLSFSTYGSATHPEVDKVKNAVEKVQKLRPDLEVDGELQLDAALVETIGKRKAPQSVVAGKANVLIFPNLDAANMTTKAMLCFTGGKLVATMILGLNGRVNDHTRGASVEEIALNIALTAARIP